MTRILHIAGESTSGQLSEIMKLLRCYFCGSHPVSYAGAWVPMGQDQIDVTMKMLILGSPPPSDGKTRLVNFGLCATCHEPYTNEADEAKMNELAHRVRDKFLEK